MKLTVCDGRWSPKRHLLYNHCICTCDFFCLTFVSCLLTVTLHIVDVRLTLNKYYLFTSLLPYLFTSGGWCGLLLVAEFVFVQSTVTVCVGWYDDDGGDDDG